MSPLAAPRPGWAVPVASLALCATWAVAVSALAAEPGGVSRIVGGQEVQPCQAASTVMLKTAGATCTGSLVHPQIVIYAAHCGAAVSDVFFGERIVRYVDGDAQLDQPARRISLPAGSCKTYPGADPTNGSDFAYCRLPEPVVDVPIVPILMGCETAMLDDRQQVMIAGYGWTDSVTRQAGIKRLTLTTSQPQSGNKIQIGDGTRVSCHGDSGGPAFVQLAAGSPLVPMADNTWRLFGIVSYGPDNCQGASTYSLVHRAVPWIESDSRIDITPCGDAAGAWAPTPLCGDFPTSLTQVGGSWATSCRLNATTGLASSTCGAPHVPAGPQVRLVSPRGNDALTEGVQSSVEAEVTGASSAQVTATLDGEPLAALSAPASGRYSFGPVIWSPGTHTVDLVAKDTSGLLAERQIVLQVAPVAATASTSATAAAGAGTSPVAEFTDVASGGCRAVSPSYACLGAPAWASARRRRRRRCPAEGANEVARPCERC